MILPLDSERMLAPPPRPDRRLSSMDTSMKPLPMIPGKV
jgi:hypothetical protein